MPTAQITLEKDVAIGEEVSLSAPGVRANGVAPYSGITTVDGVVQPNAAMNADYEYDKVVVKNNDLTPWVKGAILVATWENSAAGTGGGEYLPLTGGTLTGPLDFIGDITSTWRIQTGPAAGVFGISKIDATGAESPVLVTSATEMFVSTGQLGIEAMDQVAQFSMNSASKCIITSYLGFARWTIKMGEAVTESGGDTGSDFVLTAFGDAQNTYPPALSIARATGKTTLVVMPSIPGGVAGDVIITDGAGNLSWGTNVAALQADIASLKAEVKKLKEEQGRKTVIVTKK